MNDEKSFAGRAPAGLSRSRSLPNPLPVRARAPTGQAIYEPDPAAELARAEPPQGAWLELVRQQVDSLQFGVVQIVVHDSRVTQIERTERVRLERPDPHSI